MVDSVIRCACGCGGTISFAEKSLERDCVLMRVDQENNFAGIYLNAEGIAQLEEQLRSAYGKLLLRE